LRVVAADPIGGNFGIGEAAFPVISEQLRPNRQ